MLKMWNQGFLQVELREGFSMMYLPPVKFFVQFQSMSVYFQVKKNVEEKTYQHVDARSKAR